MVVHGWDFSRVPPPRLPHRFECLDPLDGWMESLRVEQTWRTPFGDTHKCPACQHIHRVADDCDGSLDY